MANSNDPKKTLEEQLSDLRVSKTTATRCTLKKSGTHAHWMGIPAGFQSTLRTQTHPTPEGYFPPLYLRPDPWASTPASSPRAASNEQTPQPGTENAHTLTRSTQANSPYKAHAGSPSKVPSSHDSRDRQGTAAGSEQASAGGSHMATRNSHSSTIGSPLSVDRSHMQGSQMESTPSPINQGSSSTQSSPSSESSPITAKYPLVPETSPPKPSNHSNHMEAQLDYLKYEIEGQEVPPELQAKIKRKYIPIEVVRSAARYAHFRLQQVHNAIRDGDNFFRARDWNDQMLYSLHQPGFLSEYKAEHVWDEAWITQAKSIELQNEIFWANSERKWFGYVQTNLDRKIVEEISYDRRQVELQALGIPDIPPTLAVRRDLSALRRADGRGGHRRPARRTNTPREGSDRARTWR